MLINFIIQPLSKSVLNGFNELSKQALADRNAKWIRVDAHPGYPCRVSLKDAKIGERVLAVSFTHHNVSSPYRASGPIFIREKAEMATLEMNEVPEILKDRLLSVRAYDSEHMMVGAEIVAGRDLPAGISRQFESGGVEYIHIHNANPGCFNCVAYRV